MPNRNQYSAFEQMANLQRQDERRDRILQSPPRGSNAPPGLQPVALPPYIQHNNNVQIFKSNMHSFMVKLYENLSSKHAKIFCSIQSLKTRSTQLEGIMLNQGLPAELSFQQKYYDSLANPEVKESFVKNLIENKKSLLEKRIADLQAIYDARPAELKNRLSPFEKTNSGSNLFDNVAFDWLKVLDSFIQIQICKMIAKSTEDAAKKEAKRNKFIAKKEELAKPKVLTVGEFEKLTNYSFK